MKKRIAPLLLAAALAAASFAGCGSAGSLSGSSTTSASTSATSASSSKSAFSSASSSSSEASDSSASSAQANDVETVGNGSTRVGALKGPTAMGLVDLMQDTEDGKAEGSYTFTMSGQPTEIVSEVASGDLDIALVPANLAATLYNKTKGGVSAIDINTLGVLYCVTGDSSIKSMSDLAGKTILTTGQGASPEYVINDLLKGYGVTNATLDFKSESTEVAAALANDPNQAAILPQPFVTVAEAQNTALHTAFSLTDAWKQVNPDSALLTGVTIVRNDFARNHADAVSTFLKEHETSVKAVNADPTAAGELVARYGIIAKAPIATKAIPECNIVCITGDEMKADLSGYLTVLYNADPASVGGRMPGDDFYAK